MSKTVILSLKMQGYLALLNFKTNTFSNSSYVDCSVRTLNGRAGTFNVQLQKGDTCFSENFLSTLKKARDHAIKTFDLK